MMERRHFIQGMTAAGILSSLHLQTLPTSETRNGIPYRKLGRTSETVSLIGMGGAHLGRGISEAEAIQLIRRGIDQGLNFMDNSWTITTAIARSAWAKPFRMATGKRSSS